MLFERDHTRTILSCLVTDSNLHVGTSSWRFPGWCGMLYDEDRYLWGTHFSKKRFTEHSLEEYAAVFPTVEIDSTYYAFPKSDIIDTLSEQVPDTFRFSFKVPDKITIKNYPNVKGLGDRAGQANEFFLSSGLFTGAFLKPLENIREKVGMIVFEFPHFHVDDFAHGREFVDSLDEFFGQLPDGWQYAVEIRNANLLHPDYFEMLGKHSVAHVYNQWTRMPSITEQLKLHPLDKNPFIATRYLLSPGRSFEFAREQFEPFHQIKEVDPDARASMVQILTSSPSFEFPGYLYVGNSLEGNALHTIADGLEMAGFTTEMN